MMAEIGHDYFSVPFILAKSMRMIFPHGEGSETSLPHKDFVKKLGDFSFNMMIVYKELRMAWSSMVSV